MSSILSHITQTSASSLQGTQPNQAVKQSFLQHNINSEFWGSNMNVWRKSAPGSCEKNCVIVVSATSRATAVIFLPRSRPFYPSPPLLLLLVLQSSAQLFPTFLVFIYNNWSYQSEYLQTTKENTYCLLDPLITPSLTRSTHFVNIFILYFAHDPPYPLKYNFNHFSLLEMNPIPTKVK